MSGGILILSPRAATADALRAVLGEQLVVNQRWDERYRTMDPAAVAAAATEASPEVVCLGPDVAIDTMFEIAGAIDRDHPEVCTVVVAPVSDATWPLALRSGVRDVVDQRAPAATLAEALGRAAGVAARRRQHLDRSADGQPADRHRTIVVASPKGGAGKTAVATNLAVLLAEQLPEQVALVDLDLQFGDVAAALALEPEHSLVDVGPAAWALDATTLKVLLARHRSGLFALCAPESPAAADDVPDERIAEVLTTIATDLPIVVVDTGAGLDGRALVALEHATDVVLVCGMDVATVRSLRKELDVLDQLGFTHRRHLVLNRADARVGLDRADIEALLGMPVDVAIPSSRAFPLSMNEGIPIVEGDPRSPAARQLRQLSERFLPVDQPARARGSRRLLRREGR